MNIIPKKWLLLVTGLTEEDLIKELTNSKNATLRYPKLRLGEFNTYSISELLSRGLLDNEQTKDYPVFHIYVRKTPPETSDNQYFDTSTLQLNLQSTKPVMFQIASNFNCHENGSIATDLMSGEYLTYLMSDSTQGPAASAGVGAIERLRCHIASPINLLEKTGFQVKNGKIIKRSQTPNKDRIEDVKIGLHTGLTANFDRSYSKYKSCIFYQDGTIIDQVLVSSIALDKRAIKQEDLDAVRFLLKAAYDGTYLCAIRQKSEKLVLTMVGGGVFNNPIDEVMDAITAAHVQWSTQSYLKEVILPLYDCKINAQCLIDKLIKMGYPTDNIVVTKH